MPPTVWRDGPFGPGMVQEWVDVDVETDLVELVQSDRDDLRRIAVFDAVINNGDRKGGHLLPTRSRTDLGHRPRRHLRGRGQAAHRPVAVARTTDPAGPPAGPRALAGVLGATPTVRPNGCRPICPRRRCTPSTVGYRPFCARDATRSRHRTGRRSRGPRSSRAPLGSPLVETWSQPPLPTLPGTGSAAEPPRHGDSHGSADRAGSDGAAVRLRHHALRRHAPRPRRHVRRLRPGAAGLAATAATTSTTCRTSQTSTTRCSSGPSQPVRTGGSWPAPRPRSSART